jgi:12,18-didecarboxysiroheme deacetylase
LLQFAEDKKPVVVWNMTKACNLRCQHCYAQATAGPAEGELSTAEGKALIDDLSEYGAPVVLFSGGEPLMRADLPELARYAVSKGRRAVISTNGTLITRDKAKELKDIGLSYVGVSLDGLEEVHDRFRGVKGAFQEALAGIRNCMAAGLKVGLRFTVFRQNAGEVPGIFDLLEKEGVPRVCFYHLVYAGRGAKLMEEDLGHAGTRELLDLIMDRTAALFDKGQAPEVLTVDNHADGPYVYLRLLKENPERAAEVLELLQWNQGNSSGRGIGCVSWDGSVHPDQFWRHLNLGNVRERRFSQIWEDLSHPVLGKLKDKRPHLKGRCATCRWLDICAGNFRVRAEAALGDLWAPDPACYLSDEEIARPETGVTPAP